MVKNCVFCHSEKLVKNGKRKRNGRDKFGVGRKQTHKPYQNKGKKEASFAKMSSIF